MKDVKKIDHKDAKKIIMWMNKNLSNCNDPRVFGKALVGNKKGLWRYRVENYRIISVMTESVVSIERGDYWSSERCVGIEGSLWM